jgi:nucleotide-binding universal stress UspA family protein
MINRVIAGVDFSDTSRLALTRAAALAKELEVPLVVVHVLQVPLPVIPEGFPIALDLPDTSRLEEHALEHLQNWAAPFPRAVPRVIWGQPADALSQEADSGSLLVVGQTGHSRIQNFFFGSTAARIVRMAPCDVLVVRSENPQVA